MLTYCRISVNEKGPGPTPGPLSWSFEDRLHDQSRQGMTSRMTGLVTLAPFGLLASGLMIAP